MTTCKCGKVFDEEKAVFRAFDLQKGYEEKLFCSKECLKEWVDGKQIGMWIAAGLGVALALVVLVQGGRFGLALGCAVIPYTLRQIGGMLLDMFSGGAGGEFLSILIFFFATATIVYPAYKFFQEFREYKRVKAEYDIR